VSVPIGKPLSRQWLAEAVTHYRASSQLDEHADAVLNRLLASSDAAAAFVALLADRGRWETLLTDCITAEVRARTHKQAIERVRRDREKADDAAKALKIVAALFRPDEDRHPDEDRQEMSVLFRPLDPMAEALRILANEIAFHQRHDSEFLLAASRNKDAAAAKSSGIGWLKESVQRLSGKPNYRHVETLVMAALDLQAVSPKAIEKAAIPSERMRLQHLSVTKNAVSVSAKRKPPRSRPKNLPNGRPAPPG
jgi:hypothetical protein